MNISQLQLQLMYEYNLYNDKYGCNNIIICKFNDKILAWINHCINNYYSLGSEYYLNIPSNQYNYYYKIIYDDAMELQKLINARDFLYNKYIQTIYKFYLRNKKKNIKNISPKNINKKIYYCNYEVNRQLF